MPVTTDSPIAELKLPTQLTDDLTLKGYKTVGALTRHTAAYFAHTMPLRNGDMTVITEALAKHGFGFAPPIGSWNICTSCPTCQVCGNPRAVDARQVVVDLEGRAVHHGGRPGDGPCHECDSHHRALVATRALELAGRLV